MAKEYDLVILGGGPGGYVAAIRASQLGFKTAIVEKEKLGGTCLHRGCIPSKTFLRSAEVYRMAKNSMEFGVETAQVSLNFAKVQKRKETIVQTLFQGINHLMKKGKVDVYNGTGTILGPSIFSPMAGSISVQLNESGENEILIPRHVIIATGSKPKLMEGLEVDGKYVLTSDEALNMESLPESVIIIGGGAIGIEWASMLADFGVKVTVLEYSDAILPSEDEEIAKGMEQLLKKRGIDIITGAAVLPETFSINGGVSITADVKGEKTEFSGGKILLSIGRTANIKGIGLENTNIETDGGKIKTNEFFQTKESHIYAIGDCIGGLQLAHVASREGIVAVEHMAGKNPDPINPLAIPRCIYSFPEAASVGLTEKEAAAKGYAIKTGKFSFRGNGKALVNGDADGFVKIISDQETNDLLGVHMIGPHVTEMISEGALAAVLDSVPWEISRSIHPHPSLSEVIGEAAMAVEGEEIHG